MLGFACDLNVVCRCKTIFPIESHQCPVRICGIVNRENSFFRKRQFLVCLPTIFVECFGMVGGLSLRVEIVSNEVAYDWQLEHQMFPDCCIMQAV